MSKLPKRGGPDEPSQAQGYGCPRCYMLSGYFCVEKRESRGEIQVRDHKERVALIPKDEKASKRGKKSQRKGKTFEQKVAKDLKDLGVPDVQRVPQNSTGHGLPDIRAPHAHIECKHQKQCSPRAVLRQMAADNGDPSKWSIGVIKDHGESEPFMVIPYRDGLDMYLSAIRWKR